MDWVMHNVTVVALRCPLYPLYWKKKGGQFGTVHRTTPELRYPDPTNPFYTTSLMFTDFDMHHCPFQSLLDQEKP